MTLAILLSAFCAATAIGGLIGWGLALRWQVKFYQTERHLREACSIADDALMCVLGRSSPAGVTEDIEADLARIRELRPPLRIKLE